MKIIHNPAFSKELKHILKYIADDKPGASIKFANGLKTQIRKIPDNPYMYQPSFYFNDKNMRDMTYKGYTIIYEINLDKNVIEVIKIFNKNKPPSQA